MASLSPRLFAEANGLRAGATSAEQLAEAFHLESIAFRLHALENLAERILSLVRLPGAAADDLDIPEFLRRY